MTTRDAFLPVAAQPSVETLVEQARTAEDLGYDRAWLPETWGRDAVTTLTSIAHGTDHVGIGTSIIPVYSRSPALVGQTAATLQEVADGRLRLGLGPSGPIVVEGWHGVDYGNPLRRTRETIEVVRQVLSGESVEYDGEYVELSGFRLRCDPPDPTPPIDAAGMGPKSVELAGRFGDGWHALMVTPDGLRERMADFRRGCELGGSDPADKRVTLSMTCCVSEGDGGERARELVRQHLAFYVGGMGTFYREALERQGHGEAAREVATNWASGDREAAVAAIPDDLFADLAVAGTPETAREQLRRFEDVEGVDAVSVSFPRAADRDDIDRTLAALAPD